MNTQNTTVRKAPSGRRRPIGRLIILGLLVLLIADGIYVGWRLNRELNAIRDNFESALTTLESGDLATTEQDLVQALVSAGKAEDATGHPTFLLASLLPPLTGDTDAIARLTEASALGARAGLYALEVVGSGSSSGNPLEGIYSEGHIQLAVLRRAQSALTRAETLLSRGETLLANSKRPSIDRIENALGLAQERLTQTVITVRKAKITTELLPGLLGGRGPRRYLLSFQSPSEARGGGGLMGFFGILEASKGQITLSQLAPIGELTAQKITPVESPEKWFEERYKGVAALRQWQQANFTPEFPVAAEVWLRMYDKTVGEDLDGVIAMDPFVLQNLLPAVGPIKARGFDVEVDETNAVSTILSDSYAQLDEPQQELWLGDLIRIFWDRVNSPSVDGPAMVRGIGDSLSTNHLKVYSRNKNESSMLRAVDADGSYLWAGPNLQMVFNNNSGPNKIDYFLQRSLLTRVKIRPGGKVLFTTEVTLENTAPSQGSELQLGTNPVGENRMFFDMLTPKGALFRDYELDRGKGRVALDHEADHPVFWSILKIPPGGTEHVTLKYDIPNMVLFNEAGGTFEMTWFPQTTVNPDELSLQIEPPPGYILRRLTGETFDSFSETATLDREHTVTLQVIPEGDTSPTPE